MSYGKVIVLQGPSSAGKSTLATTLQRSLEEYWWVFEADDVTRMQPTSERTGWWQPTREERPHPSWDTDARLAQWLAIYFHGIATIAKTGSNVIAVGGWLETSWLVNLASALDGIESYCVGVYCPLEEILKRESARGDRAPGYARSHYEVVHAHEPYDAFVDTSLHSLEECIQAVNGLLASPPATPFFARIRAAFTTPSLPK